MLFVGSVHAQLYEAEALPNVRDRYDMLTGRWQGISAQLENYEGLGRFCDNAQFREQTLHTLSLIHHYDSLVMRSLLDPSKSLDVSHGEIKHTLKDIHKFEEKYGVKSFLEHLKSNCIMYREIESDKEASQKDTGVYSYDGQKLILETELNTYMKHVSKRVEAIEKHLHLLDINDLKPLEFSN